MREKLLDLMKSEGLKPSQLAELLEINPAGISHILAGRNKPSCELLQKILRRFPRISPDWLLLDSGSMYRSDYTAADSTAAAVTAGTTSPTTSAQPASGMIFDNGLFGSSGFGTPRSQAPAVDKTNSMGTGGFAGMSAGSAGSNGKVGAESVSGTGIPRGTDAIGNGGIGGRSNAAIQRIVIFYDDQTCECFFPTKR